MFSAPGAGLLIIPPVDAPLHLIETSFGSSSNSSINDALGCRLPETHEADDDEGSNEGRLRDASTQRGRLKDLSPGSSSVGRRESQYPTHWAKTSPQMEGFQQMRGISPRGVENTVPVDGSNGDHRGGVSNRGNVERGRRDGVYAGKILVISRGECTFERKVGI